MKVSIATLCFLTWAVDFGSLVRITDESKPEKAFQPSEINLHGSHFHSPSDCCMTYIRRNIRCVFMAGYYETSSGCSRPGVIFSTKNGKQVCADPHNERIQECMNGLSGGPKIEELFEEGRRIDLNM
ncbi:C-C motif chemokine 15 isoform X2 [Echinops telfairi]|uniref:C-C motif chemokine 15 isoform X2 n=1 Tax=Echinops telfairi TaxID=9371 RepID=A0AC55DVU4_ECHTE|nr:C-C motif chemokine 15 isoform X2 [Echinops telfairi]